MNATTTNTKEAASKSAAALLAKESELRGSLTELAESIKSDKPGALDIWKRVHAQILELKTAINTAYKHASNHDRETGVDQGRAEKKAKAEERAARKADKGKDRKADRKDDRKDDRGKDDDMTPSASDDPDNV